MGSEATLDATIPPVLGREIRNQPQPPQSQSDGGSAKECPHGLLFILTPDLDGLGGTSRMLPWETVAVDVPCCLHS